MAKMTDELVMKCFQIVAQVGAARSYYINAIQCAKEGKFEDAESMIKEGDVSFNQGHTEHTSLLSMEASGERKRSFADPCRGPVDERRRLSDHCKRIYRCV